MNDLDLVRTLRADVPAAALERVAAGRDRLLASIAGPAPRVRRPWRLALPAGAVTAAAAVAAIVVLGPGVHPAARPAASRPSAPAATRRSAHSAPSERISLAARVLAVAAGKVASEPVTEPRDGQWIYTKSVQTQTGQPAQWDEEWETFDGRQSAYFQGGQLIVHHGPAAPSANATGLAAYDDDPSPLTAYNALASLPSSPAAILAAVGSIVGTTPRQWESWSSGSVMSEVAPANQGQTEFDYLTQLLWNAFAAAPATAQANVYRALAAIPGVRVERGLTNAVGRTAIGVSADGVAWLLLDPQTYQVNGLREKLLSERSVMVKGAPLTFSGAMSLAWAEVALVRGPGVR